MSMQNVILVGIGCYVVLMLLVGVYAARRTHSVAEFAVAGRSLPLWLCTATIIATWFGGAILIGGAGAAYESGLMGVIADPFGGALSLVLVGLFFVRLFRRLRFYSFPELLEQRFGPTAGTAASIISMASSIMWIAGMLVAFGVVFETLTGLPLTLGIIGGALVVIIYTSIGGMFAVAITDFVQLVLIAIGMVVLLVVILVDVGGWGPVAGQLPEHTFRVIPQEHSLDEWLPYLRAWFIIGIADIASQSLLQRAMSAKSEDIAQKSFFLAAVGYLALGLVPVTLGIIGSVTSPGLANAESIIPVLAIEHLHPVAIAVFVGALLATIMSSCDSAILSVATIFTTNILPRVKRNPSDRLKLWIIRLAIPVAGVLAIAGALNARVVFNTMLDANLYILAIVMAPLIFGVWWKKANRTGALAAMAGGLAGWFVVSQVSPNSPADLIGFFVSVAVMLIVTPLTQTFDPPRGLVDHDGNPVELTNRIGLFR